MGFGVEAGDTVFLQLGETTTLNAVPFPSLPSSVTWSNSHNLTFNGNSIVDLLTPTALPTQTGWYTVTIMDDAGCISSDSVLIIVDPYKPIYIPNVISANFDDVNDRVTVYGNHAATDVELFQIYDRWGGLIWEGRNFHLNDPSLGWDGTSKGKPVTPGVFAYIAVVRFLDGIPLTFHGTVTVLR
jgi:gliding motility-associated-like protein